MNKRIYFFVGWFFLIAVLVIFKKYKMFPAPLHDAFLVQNLSKEESLKKRLIENPQTTGGNPSRLSPRPSIPTRDDSSTELTQEELTAWLHQEAQNIDVLQAPSEKQLHEFYEIARNLTKPLQRHLLEVAKNPQAAANEKILSTFILTLSGEKSWESLSELATTPPELSAEETPPHSPEETRRMQDKALRIMAIDQLVDQAKQNRSRVPALEEAIARILDPYIKSYAEQKLAQLKRSFNN